MRVSGGGVAPKPRDKLFAPENGVTMAAGLRATGDQEG